MRITDALKSFSEGIVELGHVQISIHKCYSKETLSIVHFISGFVASKKNTELVTSTTGATVTLSLST